MFSFKNYEKTFDGFVKRVEDFENTAKSFEGNLDRIWDAARAQDYRKVERLCDEAKVFGSNTLSDITCELSSIASAIERFYKEFDRMKSENEHLLAEVENLKEYDELVKKMNQIREIVK